MLDDPRAFRLERHARGLAYWSLAPHLSVDAALLDDLARAARGRIGVTVRICLHQDAGDPLQQMIVAHTPRGRVFPHAHPLPEVLHLLRGALDVALLDDAGACVALRRLRARGVRALRLPAGVWHVTLARAPVTIVHELRPGPFDPEATRTPDWWREGEEAPLRRLLVRAGRAGEGPEEV